MPDGAPPSYESATHTNPAPNSQSTLSPNAARNGIPPLYRRSMEDEGRPLPSGWLRQYDPEHGHQYFVDTNADPPRSIWQHPYDDEQYMGSLGKEERQRIQALQKQASEADMASDDDTEHHHQPTTGQSNSSVHPPTQAMQQQPPPPSQKPSLGRKLKDKLTNSTHEQREEERRQRAIVEQQAYERHMLFRQAMAKAIETGQPQFVCKDRDGKDLYIEPPGGPPGMEQGYGGYGGGGGGVGGYGYNPYQQHGGPYANPNARYIRPAYPYSRPYGRGYGGGYGLPIMGGLAGGLLLGGMMGGF